MKETKGCSDEPFSTCKLDLTALGHVELLCKCIQINNNNNNNKKIKAKFLQEFCTLWLHPKIEPLVNNDELM